MRTRNITTFQTDEVYYREDTRGLPTGFSLQEQEMEIKGRLKKAPSCFMHLLEQEGKGIIIIYSTFF